MCEVDVIANSLVLYLPFCSTLNKNFFSLLSLLSGDWCLALLIDISPSRTVWVISVQGSTDKLYKICSKKEISVS